MSIWRPHTTRIVIGGLVAILIALVASYAYSHFQPTTEVRIASGVFQVKLANTEPARLQGLSGVDKMSANDGLLMVYDTDAQHGIWMKDMKIPIDIIWLDKDKKVIFIVTDAAPELGETKTYKPRSAARFVLEIPAGMVKKSAIKIGDVATFELTEEAL